MANEIISYIDMCQRERSSLQRGMNFNLGGTHSVILMSVRPNAPYRDRIEDGGSVLIYEGHDVPKTKSTPTPKKVDQPIEAPNGAATQNGLFFSAAQNFKSGERLPEKVRVYEKLRQGIWSYNGIFHLIDAWQEHDGKRNVFKFKLEAVEGEEDLAEAPHVDPKRRRVIPTSVKLEVWKRDGGRCVTCGATDELHFDHVLPFARGGTSITADNVQLLCARHNIAKRDQII
jgi:HNH endonuclease